MCMLLLWYVMRDLFYNITAGSDSTTGSCAGTFRVRATAVVHRAVIVRLFDLESDPSAVARRC